MATLHVESQSPVATEFPRLEHILDYVTYLDQAHEFEPCILLMWSRAPGAFLLV